MATIWQVDGQTVLINEQANYLTFEVYGVVVKDLQHDWVEMYPWARIARVTWTDDCPSFEGEGELLGRTLRSA